MPAGRRRRPRRPPAAVAPIAVPSKRALPPPPDLPISPDPPPWTRGAPCVTPRLQSVDALRAHALRDAPEGLESALMVCSVRLPRKNWEGYNWDILRGAPDPMARLRIDERDHGYSCASNTYSASLSWPGVDLSPGAPIQIDVFDEDLRDHDFVGDARVSFDGALSFALSSPRFEGSCSAIPRAAVEALLPDRIDDARLAILVQSEAQRLDPTAPRWGFSDALDDRTRAAVSEVAGHVGWDDPRGRGGG